MCKKMSDAIIIKNLICVSPLFCLKFLKLLMPNKYLYHIMVKTENN